MADSKLKSSDITPEAVYLNRRNFIRAGLVAGSATATGLAYRFFNPSAPGEVALAKIENVQPATADVDGDKLNTFDEITNYNNFYEFSTDKLAVAKRRKILSHVRGRSRSAGWFKRRGRLISTSC